MLRALLMTRILVNQSYVLTRRYTMMFGTTTITRLAAALTHRISLTVTAMSHHLFLLSPSDTPIYSLSHQSTKSTTGTTNPLAANLPSWSASAFAGTLTALSGASSVSHGHGTGGGGGAGRVGQQDRHVIQMIANASLDVIEDVMRKDGAMSVLYSSN